MRAGIAFGLLALVACGEPPPCGVDRDGEDVPFCEVSIPGEGDPIAYCPLEHWAADDDCNTCGCSEDGLIVCTSLQCGGTTGGNTTSETSDTGL
jgi:hypothetical protein